MLRDLVIQAISPLVGLPLVEAGRAADLTWWIFGKVEMVRDATGREREWGECHLHIMSPWRLRGPDGIVVGKGDMYWPRSGQPALDGFDWDVQGANRCDELMKAFIESVGPVAVESAVGDDVGGIEVRFAGGSVLQVFPHCSLDGEHWRLLFREGRSVYLVGNQLGVTRRARPRKVL